MQLMIDTDKRDPGEIGAVIVWCQQDEFWQNNILSVAKLRKQYDHLVLKMNSNGKPKSRYDKNMAAINESLKRAEAEENEKTNIDKISGDDCDCPAG
jgi:hypothetical protein